MLAECVCRGRKPHRYAEVCLLSRLIPSTVTAILRIVSHCYCWDRVKYFANVVPRQQHILVDFSNSSSQSVGMPFRASERLLRTLDPRARPKPRLMRAAINTLRRKLSISGRKLQGRLGRGEQAVQRQCLVQRCRAPDCCSVRCGPESPYAYVTTPGFLAQFGFESLRDLPDIEKLEDAGLLCRTSGDLLNGAASSGRRSSTLSGPSCAQSPGCWTRKTWTIGLGSRRSTPRGKLTSW
jgi:hypothetical protein